jgi:hypothetical protein
MNSSIVRLSDADLANSLHRRRPEARLVSPEPSSSADFNLCHPNAEAYVRENPDCTVIRGWLFEDSDGFTYINAHSVVRRKDGSLFDPTPLRLQCPFIEHEGTEKDFAIQTHNRSRVQFPPIDPKDFDFGAPIEEGGNEFNL